MYHRNTRALFNLSAARRWRSTGFARIKCDMPVLGQRYREPQKRNRHSEADLSRAALIEAAGAVFLRKGYHAATMNDVAKAAGISKKTIYELFKSKDELFCAIIGDQQRDIAFPEPEPDWSVVDILTANLVCLAYFLLAPERLSFVRLVLAEYMHSP